MKLKTIEPTEKELTFIAAYFTCLFFTENRMDDLDDGFERESIIDCLAFYSRIDCYLPTDDVKIAAAGHDFWLTRNGHGAGFWDGDWPAFQGEMFTNISKSFGEVHPVFEEY